MRYLIIFGIISILIAFFTYKIFLVEYFADREYTCLIVEKYKYPKRYKVSEKRFLKLKFENNIFDIQVSPTTFGSVKVGQLIVFELDNSIVNPDPELEQLSFNGFLVLVFGMGCFIFWGVFKLFPPNLV